MSSTVTYFQNHELVHEMLMKKPTPKYAPGKINDVIREAVFAADSGFTEVSEKFGTSTGN